MKTFKNLCLCTLVCLLFSNALVNAKTGSPKAAKNFTDPKKDFVITLKKKSLFTTDTIYVTFFIHLVGTDGSSYQYSVYINLSSQVPAGSNYFLELTMKNGAGSYIQPSWTVAGGNSQSLIEDVTIYTPFTESLITDLYETPTEFNGDYISVNDSYSTY